MALRGSQGTINHTGAPRGASVGMVTKKDWRKVCRARRAELARDPLLRDRVIQSLLAVLSDLVDSRESPIVGGYCAIGSEVDLFEELLGFCRAQGVILALPCCEESRVMIYRKCGAFPEEKDAAGIPASVSGEAVVPDVLVAPALGWSAAGHRLGYGGGYFDRYLEVHDVAVIGVSFEALEVPETLFDIRDRPLAMLVSESGVRHFVRSPTKRGRCEPELQHPLS